MQMSARPIGSLARRSGGRAGARKVRGGRQTERQREMEKKKKSRWSVEHMKTGGWRSHQGPVQSMEELGLYSESCGEF